MDYNAMYEEYKNMGGEYEQGKFIALAKKQKRMIDYQTFNRIDYENEKLATLARECILELIQKYEENEKLVDDYWKTGGVKSETVGKLRQDYVTVSLDEKRRLENSFDKLLRGIIKSYFAQTGLMYRGVTDEDKLRRYDI